MTTPNYAVPIHENPHLCSTDKWRCPITEYRHTKMPIKEYKHKKTPPNGVPKHENPHLPSTNLWQRPIMEYKHKKPPQNAVTIHDNALLWSKSTWKRPLMLYRYVNMTNYNVPTHETPIRDRKPQNWILLRGDITKNLTSQWLSRRKPVNPSRRRPGHYYCPNIQAPFLKWRGGGGPL